MHLLYLYMYFTTPAGSWSTRVYEFAKNWVKAGTTVTVVTAVYEKSDLNPTKFIEKRNFEGIQVIIINILISNKQPFLKRVYTFLVYAIIASYYSLKLNYDVCLASSGPITTWIPGLLSKLIRRKKLALEARDLWPRGAIELGILNNKFLQKIALGLESYAYKKADLIIALSSGIKEEIIQKCAFTNTIVVPNGANISFFQNTKKQKSNSKIAIHTGNIGPLNNSMLLFNAARILHQRKSDIKILLIGDGQQKDELLTLQEKEQLTTFQLLDKIPKLELVTYLKDAFVSLCVFKDTPICDTFSPNKLFESLAAGIPVVQTTQGWIKTFLEKEKCGFTCSASSPEELADLLEKLALKDLETEQQNALKTAQLYFDKDFLSQKMLYALNNLV